jgi:hypothetical protein
MRRRLKLGHRLALRRRPRREEPLVPVAGDDAPAVARQFVGKILRIADAQDLGTRVVPETPGRKGDRGQMRFQMARRQADDQPADMAPMHRRQLCRDKLDTLVRSKRGARAELAKTARGKGRKVVTQQGGTLLPGSIGAASLAYTKISPMAPKEGGPPKRQVPTSCVQVRTSDSDP